MADDRRRCRSRTRWPSWSRSCAGWKAASRSWRTRSPPTSAARRCGGIARRSWPRRRRACRRSSSARTASLALKADGMSMAPLTAQCDVPGAPGRDRGRLVEQAHRRAAAAAGRARGAADRGDALRDAGRRQAAARLPGDGGRRACSASPRPAPRGSPRRSRCCTPTRWCMTTCRRWTTTTCAAASPARHRQFDEATAILAGDALQTRAFEVLAEADTHADPQARCELVLGAGPRPAGARGMAGGQMIDMAAEGQALTRGRGRPAAGAEDRPADPVQRRGRRDPRPGRAADARSRSAAYGRDLGAAFQIADDVLDAVGTDARASARPPARTQAAGKATLVALLGVERARTQARDAGRPGGRRIWTRSAPRPTGCARSPRFVVRAPAERGRRQDAGSAAPTRRWSTAAWRKAGPGRRR